MSSGSLPVQRHGYTEKQKYLIYVLWLHGSTQTAIANVLHMRRKQVAGIVARSEYTNRAGMTKRQRQKYISELKAIRKGSDGKLIDDGLLPDAVFKTRDLAGDEDGE